MNFAQTFKALSNPIRMVWLVDLKGDSTDENE